MATFTVNTPQAANFPANDQPLMNANNGYLQQFGQRDHQFTLTGAVNNTDGTHKQLTLTNEGAPGFTGASSVVFANTDGTNSQLFFQNASGTAQITAQKTGVPAAAASSGVNAGVSYLPGGLLFQWGVGVSNGSKQVSFNVNFNTATYNPLVTFCVAGTVGGAVPLFVSSTTNLFTISQAGIGVFWMAIGQA